VSTGIDEDAKRCQACCQPEDSAGSISEFGQQAGHAEDEQRNANNGSDQRFAQQRPIVRHLRGLFLAFVVQSPQNRGAVARANNGLNQVVSAHITIDACRALSKVNRGQDHAFDIVQGRFDTRDATSAGDDSC